MQNSKIENIEVDLLLEAVFKRYGYDFRHYARASIQRRINHFINKSGFKTISDLTAKVMHDKILLSELVQDFSITVTEMFRDPDFYIAFKNKVLPFLKTFPFARIWHAGCATGEEVYSLAILLLEEGFYNRAKIIATDFNDNALEKAKAGIFSVENIKPIPKIMKHLKENRFYPIITSLNSIR